MRQVTFSKEFVYRAKPESAIGTVTVYPKGWSGEILQSRYELALEEGAIEAPEAEKPATGKRAEKAEKEGADAGGRATS